MIKRLTCLIGVAISSLLAASDLEDQLIKSSEVFDVTNYCSKKPCDRSEKIKILEAIEKAMKVSDYGMLTCLLGAYVRLANESELGDLFFWSSCNKKETKLLIKAGANVNHKKYYRGCIECRQNTCSYHIRSPLLYKLYKGSIEEAISLVKCGASLYSRDRLGRTPVHMAVLLARTRDNIEPIYKFLWHAQIRNKETPILLWLKDNKGRCAMDMLYEDEKLAFAGSREWPIIDEHIKQEFGSIRDLISKVKENPIFKISIKE